LGHPFVLGAAFYPYDDGSDNIVSLYRIVVATVYDSDSPTSKTCLLGHPFVLGTALYPYYDEPDKIVSLYRIVVIKSAISSSWDGLVAENGDVMT
jgi:hypothetical protein